jgi:hypothetical protein
MPASPTTKPLKKLMPGMGLYQVMHWPGKAPDKSKPWAVANLETGDVNGRWHATKEEALAQARALYARLGDKAKVHSEEGTRNAFFFSANPSLVDGAEEDGVRWVEAIEPRTYSVPSYGDVVITPDKLENFISNLNNNVRGQEVAIDYEHGLDPNKGKKAAGWIRGARKNAAGKLELAIDFTEPAKQEIRNKEWRYFSLEWDDAWQHPDGVIYTDVVMGGALTNRPVAKGLMPINFSEIFTETVEFGESKEMEHSEPGTGQPPQPRTDEDGSDDPAIQGGWRRDTPPIAYDDIVKFAEPQLLGYLDGAVKSLKDYIDATPDYGDKACVNDLVSRIYGMQGRLQATQNGADGEDMPMGSMGGMMSEVQNLAQEAFKELEKIDIEIAKKMNFSEPEAIGYLQASITGLERTHTNRGNELIEEIRKLVSEDSRTRSFNELMHLTHDVRSYLRNGSDTSTSTSTSSTSPKGGKAMGELTDRDLLELRAVLDVEDDGKILEAVKIKFGELTALREAVSASDQERIFAEQYPDFYRQHMMLMERDRNNAARVFAESASKIRKSEGYGLKETKQGLSVAAMEKVIETHKKFAEGKGTTEDFENCIKAITNGGIVQFGEIGSSSDDALPEVDTTTATGVAGARKIFAEVVSKIQRDNPDMPYLEAVAEASKKHPDLAESYKLALPA